MNDSDETINETTDEAASPLTSLRGKFLLAGANLVEASFARTVILVVRHDAEGALGIVVNRPLGVTLGEACGEHVQAAEGLELPLFHGGPCSGQVMAVHGVASLAERVSGHNEAGEDDENDDEEPWSEPVAPGVWFTTRSEALVELMRHAREEIESAPVKFTAGYAGWGAGQLEAELAEGAWQVCDAPPGDVFAGGGPGFPPPPATTSLPPGAAELLALLSNLIVGGHDPTPALAAGVRQWVRLSTRTNLKRLVPERLIPDDPSVN